ncbi:MAG: CsgG/HfaB family protein [bacterium]
MFTIYYRNKLIFTLGALLISLSALCSCTVKRPAPCIKNGRHYGVVDELIVSHDWDSSYKRGLSYAEGECWEQASIEFNTAISQRTKDQWRVRTYGMHVMDQYFPHRELGIVYLNQGMIDAAIAELTTSIQMTKSSKAEYYLDQARKKKLERGDMDHESPRIAIHTNRMYNNTIYTNQSLFHVKGTAEDNYFVASVSINEKPVYIPVSAPHLPFDVEVDLEPGSNALSLSAHDLVENSCEREVYVLLDQEGPTVIVTKETAGGKIVGIHGVVYDSGGLSRVSFGEETIPLDPDKTYKEFSYIIGNQDKVSFVAEDRAGNSTEGIITHNDSTTGNIVLAENSLILNDTLSMNNALAGSPDGDGPIITLFEHKSTVFQPSVVITGIIRSQEALQNIWINDRRFFLFDTDKGLNRILKRIWHGPRTNFYFTKVVEGLEEGYNEIIVKAQDSKGQTTQQRIAVVYRMKEFERIGSRWALGLLPFSLFEDSEYHFSSPRPHPLSMFQDELRYVFFHTRRFNLLERERIEAVMHELGLQSSSAVDKKTGPALGRLLSAEVILPGSVTEIWDGYDRCIHVIARLIDVETGETLAIKDVYGPWRTLEDEKYFLEGLAKMFVEEFPLLKGSIIEKKGTTVTINIGAEDLIREGMRIIFPGTDESILGEARITAVKSKYSFAAPYQKDIVDMIKVGDIVVTK